MKETVEREFRRFLLVKFLYRGKIAGGLF